MLTKDQRVHIMCAFIVGGLAIVAAIVAAIVTVSAPIVNEYFDVFKKNENTRLRIENERLNTELATATKVPRTATTERDQVRHENAQLKSNLKQLQQELEVTKNKVSSLESTDTVGVLIKALKDEETRHHAAYVLGYMGWIGVPPKEAVPALIDALSHKDARRYAAYALGRIGESAKPAVPEIIKALKDEDKEVRKYAVGALKRIGTPEALKAVEEYEQQK